MSEPAQFVLVVKDTADRVGVEVAGLSQPEEFDPASPSHILGKWIAANFDELAQRAALAHKRAARVEAGETVPILIEPEKTVIRGGA